MERKGVLIEAGIVQNIIVWGDESEAQYEADGWDIAMETTDLPRQPGIGWTYNENDGFRPPKDYPSWVWSEQNNNWEAPIKAPEGDYTWNETTQTWDEIPTTTE